MKIILRKLTGGTKAFFLLYFLLSSAMIAIWYQKGYMYGGGDIGLPLYDPKLLSEISKYTWWSSQGTGFSYPVAASSYTFYLLLSVFQKLHLSPLALQKLFFFSVLYFSFLGSLFLIKEITKDNRLAFVASFIYIFNPYTMMNVFHRFAHTSMVMLAFIPWTLFTIYVGLTQKKIFYSAFLGLLSFVGSYSFGTPSFLATWWFIVVSLFIYLFFTKAKQLKDKKYYGLWLISFVLLWVGINLRWLLPFLRTAHASLLLTTTTSGNVESLRGVSRYFSLPYAFRGINSFFLVEQKDWGDIFSTPLFTTISWLGVVGMLCSLFFKKRRELFRYFLFLFLLTIFISKGSQIPLGQFMVASFSLIPALGVFRNPFEKFGILYPITFSYLSSLGFFYLLSKAKKKLIKFLLALLLVAFVAVYHWPLWTDKIFGSSENPALVKVPESYKDAKEWFSKFDPQSLRILHLPFILGDGVVYKWDKGYSGLEPSQLFFPGSSLSHYIGYELADRKYTSFAVAVKRRNKELFHRLINEFNISHLVIHKDVEESFYVGDSAEGIGNFLASFDFSKDGITFIKERDLNELVFFSTKKNNNNSKVTFEKYPILFDGSLRFIDTKIIINGVHSSYMFIPQKEISFLPTRYIFPDLVINFPPITISKENVVGELPYARILPGDIVYPLIRLKELIESLPKSEEERFLAQLNYSSKRLTEVNRLLEKGDFKNATFALRTYTRTLEELTPRVKLRIVSASEQYDFKSWQYYVAILLRQREMLQSHILPKASDTFKKEIEVSLRLLEGKLADIGILPIYPNISVVFPDPTFRFTIRENGAYSFLFEEVRWSDFLDADTDFYIDGRKLDVQLKRKDKHFALENIEFVEGVHELAIDIQELDTLAREGLSARFKDGKEFSNKSGEGIELTAKEEENFIEYEVKDINPDSLYPVSFSYWTKYGVSPKLSIIQNIDPIKEGKVVPIMEKPAPGLGYELHWRSLGLSFRPSALANSALFRVSLEPWNDCKSLFFKEPDKCSDVDFFKRYNRPSIVEIKDFSIKRIPLMGVYMQKEGEYLVNQISALNLTSISPSRYEIVLPEDNVGLLTFKETFHENWRLKDREGRILGTPHVLVNGFANGWLIQKQLPTTNLIIEFEPEVQKRLGNVLGILLLGVGVLVILWVRRNERLY